MFTVENVASKNKYGEENKSPKICHAIEFWCVYCPSLLPFICVAD